MPPAAARKILEAIHGTPDFRWVVDRIHVLRPINLRAIRHPPAQADQARGGAPGDPPSRVTGFLVDVAYVIEAHFSLTPGDAATDRTAQHIEIFRRRARNGRFFRRPTLGAQAYPAQFALIPEGAAPPPSALPAEQCERDLGWMARDVEPTNNIAKSFFRARLRAGVLDIGACVAAGPSPSASEWPALSSPPPQARPRSPTSEVGPAA
jgi:CRISPR-associated protein Cas5d